MEKLEKGVYLAVRGSSRYLVIKTSLKEDWVLFKDDSAFTYSYDDKKVSPLVNNKYRMYKINKALEEAVSSIKE